MMMDVAETAIAYPPAHAYHRLDRIRRRYCEVFGRECTLPDAALVQRYTLSTEGDLIMIVR